MAIVYTGGTFDLLHHGHINLLQKCYEISQPNGKVVVSINRDQFIYRYKQIYPAQNENERMSELLKCEYVDEVILNLGDEDSRIAIELVKPNYIVIGSDWAKKDYYSQMGFNQDWLDSRDIGLVYIPYTKGISSTILRDKLN